MRSIRYAALAAFLLTPLLLSPAAGAERKTCEEHPPVIALDLAEIYSDPRHSVPNAAVEQQNRAKLAALGQFLQSSEQALDDPRARKGDPAINCAWSDFRAWAAAGALTGQPAHFSREGTAKRDEMLVGINVIALKFRAKGYDLDRPVLDWLGTLNHQNMDYFDSATNRGNLYSWSGAASALYAILSHEPRALDYEARAWRTEMAAISPDGTVDGETARGQRALIYHLYSLSATLVHQAAREALGRPADPQDMVRIGLLTAMIGRNLCDPAELETKAQAKMEPPGDWAYRVINGFGPELLGGDWSRCGRPGVVPIDVATGGDGRRTRTLLRRGASPLR